MEPEATTSNTFPFNNNKPESLPLLTYLNSCPVTFGYRLTESAQREILKRLFSELWRSNEDYRSLFFPNGFGEGLDAYKLSLALGEGSSEYSQTQKGKACGHVFKKGEGVYRCRNCALDETCVFCSRCFHATNHDGHDVSFSVNSGSGGCCDCGDPEAWKRPIQCTYHTLNYSSPDSGEFEKIQYEETLPHDLINPIHNTISTVLDFMLDTLSASPEEMTPPLNEADVRKEANRAALYIRDHVNIVNEEKLFAVVLWNDEHHSFHEVIDQVIDATGCSQAEAKAMAKRVDSYGRDIVKISEDIPLLRSIANTISSIGLAVTIRSARDTFREGMCGLFIDWLKDLAGGIIGSDSSLLRDIICEELCKEWNKPRCANIDMKLKIRFAGDTQNGRVKEFNGDYDVLMEEHSSDAIEPMDEDESIIYRGTSFLMQKVEDFKKKLRLDKLLILDLRLWKEARAGLRELYIGTLITNTEYKKIMGIRFARNYVKLAKAFLTPDREPEHSIVLFSVQLFTVPTISTILVTKYKFLTTIFTILHTFFTSNTVGEDLDSIDPNAKIDCDSDAFKNRRYFHVFQDLRYIISNDAVKNAVPKNTHYLQQYLNLIALFQGMNPNIRATHQHVEYENDSWINAFNVTLQIAKSCRQFSDCYTCNTRTLCITIHKMDETGDDHEDSLYHSSVWVTSTPGSYGPFAKSAKFSVEDKDNNLSSLREPEFHDVIFPANPYYLSFRIVKFKVSSQPVSFHHPLNWFLAELLENVNLLDDEMLKQHGFGSFQSMMMGFDVENNEELGDVAQRVREKILGVFDYPLRVLVLLVQIRAGLWVRNGFGIRGQCHHYREISLRENTYDEDTFLLQTAFILLDPNIVLVTILDRFDLVEWFNGVTNHEVYDNSQLTFIAEELLTLLITCVSERANAAGFTMEQKIRREIIHGLCIGPIAYSELTKRIPERLAQNPIFDEILTRLTNYKAPDSLTDHGSYELHDEYFDEVDPYFVHYSRNNREEAEEALKNRLKKRDATDSTPLLMPKLTPITSGPYVKLGNILHARLLNQIIYYSLWHVKTDEKIKSDTLVEEALHLIMLALLDENNDITRECKRKGKQKANETSISSDIDIPGFIYYAVSDRFQEIDNNAMKSQGTSLLDLLLQLSCDQSFKEFHHKLEFIINKFEQFESDCAKLTINRHREKLRIDLQSKGTEETKLSDYERKKQAAKERQKKIMEQFAKAQQSFIEKHEELYDENEGMEEDLDLPTGEEQSGTDSLKMMENNWSYPSGTCIVCQEETNASSLYGMLGLIQPSSLLRHTPFNDKDYIFEADDLPESLDFKYDRSIPFGVASSVYVNARPLSKGFPSKSCRQGLYASTCGHLMHVKCFDTYFASLEQRHSLQLARNHPEDVKRKEFMCPLCKSLGNILLPIIWKVKKEVFPGIMETQEDYATWLRDKVGSGLEKLNLTRSSESDLSYSNTNPNRRYTPFTAGATFDSNVDFPTFVPTSQNQPRRRNSSGAGRIRDAITHIVHMLRNPAAFQNNDESGPSIVVSDDFQSLPVQGPFRVDAHTPSDDDDQEYIRRMYSRLAEVMQMTYQKITTEITFQANSLKSIEYMWDLFGYTISCIEIGQRGISNTINEGSIGSTLIDGINSQTLTLLRILSETILTYMDTMLIGQNSEFGLKQITTYRIQQIFYGHPSFQQENSAHVIGSTPLVDNTRKMIGLFGPSLQFTKVKPLLLEDPFLVLVEICMYTVSVVEYEVYHMMRLLYAAEIVKVIVSLVESAVNEKTKAWEENERFKKKFPDLRESQGSSIRDFIIWVTRRVGNNEQDIAKFLDKIDVSAFVKLIRTFCLPYLRKCVILLNARFGIVFPVGIDDLQTQDETEFVRLSKFLGFPSIEQICSISSDITMLSVIAGWCNHLCSLRKEASLTITPSGTLNDISMIHDVHVSSGVASNSSQVPQQNHQFYRRIDVKVNHPAIFELVGLPKRLDSLFEESLKKVCEKCKTVPHDPALCLLCGTFVCSQSYCCSENDRGLENDRGECNLHTKSCGGEIGIYLLVKKCVILLLHVDNGCYMNAPYLDKHGEVDGLKRGKPQFLNQKRYDEIRKVWLTHGVPIHVARKIEQAFDLGGWPTF
ncbi:3024_t:CDS:10 [Funneliformis geosporum]|uniref:E3 ubiquitin-protein ligase n=1 Tax=Funneliformis geosporum TaxID=1117311 RepID=A0A9W4WNE2_9GLOM|nr:3024_t:CDS:10 [Funneliformis geosporum]